MGPSITVVTGRPAALRLALSERVAALRCESPLEPITVLVGSSLQRPHLARWLAADLGAHANVRILLPGDLALLLGAPSLVAQGRRALPPLADRVLLAQEAAVSAGYFEPVAEAPGFAEALHRLVRELRGAGCDLASLGPLLEGLTDAPEKASSLARLLRDFEARRTGFYGPDDALAAADPERLDGLALLVYGATEVSPALERLILAIGRRMPVTFFLADVPAAADTRLSALRQRLAHAGVNTEPAPQQQPHQPQQPQRQEPALERVRERLFEPPRGEPLDPDDSLHLVSAPDPAREVRAAARACLAWAAEGVPFWEMALAYRHGDAYRPLVEAAFAEANIPVYLHEGSPVAERPVGR